VCNRLTTRCSQPSTLLQLLDTCARPVNKRPYESTDLASVIEIYTASIRVLAAPYYSPEQIAAWAPVTPDAARWQERLSRLRTIVAESNGVLAGFASYTYDGYLDFLFTHPAFARRGVATKLYQLVESALRAASAPRVTTHASLAARPFFDRHGFQLDAEECVECRGAYLRRFAMHKQLRNERNV
jgi:putative acetyltransferase